MNIVYIFYMILPIALVFGIFGFINKKKIQQVSEVWTVNETTFAGEEAENQARQYAQYLIKNKVKVKVSIPGCPVMRADEVWNL